MLVLLFSSLIIAEKSSLIELVNLINVDVDEGIFEAAEKIEAKF